MQYCEGNHISHQGKDEFRALFQLLSLSQVRTSNRRVDILVFSSAFSGTASQILV